MVVAFLSKHHNHFFLLLMFQEPKLDASSGFYKELSLEANQQQIAVDIFAFGVKPLDLATTSECHVWNWFCFSSDTCNTPLKYRVDYLYSM